MVVCLMSALRPLNAIALHLVNDECDSATHPTKTLFDEDNSPPTIMTVDNDSGNDLCSECSLFLLLVRSSEGGESKLTAVLDFVTQRAHCLSA